MRRFCVTYDHWDRNIIWRPDCTIFARALQNNVRFFFFKFVLKDVHRCLFAILIYLLKSVVATDWKCNQNFIGRQNNVSRKYFKKSGVNKYRCFYIRSHRLKHIYRTKTNCFQFSRYLSWVSSREITFETKQRMKKLNSVYK